jgi:hypothetical protein
MKLVKIKNLPDRITAEQVQQRLKQERITSVLQSPEVGMFGSFGVGTPAGIDLYVREEQQERAKKILRDLFGDL